MCLIKGPKGPEAALGFFKKKPPGFSHFGREQQAKQQEKPHPNTGRSPVRPIAVVVYLIRPNRGPGLTAVLLGKSTTTRKATHVLALVVRARASWGARNLGAP